MKVFESEVIGVREILGNRNATVKRAEAIMYDRSESIKKKLAKVIFFLGCF